jgi:GNAT superfamily N-acetyltransferase
MIKITNPYSVRRILALSKFSFEEIKESKEIKNAFNNLRVFYQYIEDIDFHFIRISGFNKELSEHAFDFILDFHEGQFSTEGIAKYNKRIVCHPHIFTTPEYQNKSIISQLLKHYHSLGVVFMFSNVTQSGLKFMKNWYKKNNIPYGFFDALGNPRRQNDEITFFLGHRF